jgi:hypothetical protein
MASLTRLVVGPPAPVPMAGSSTVSVISIATAVTRRCLPSWRASCHPMPSG